MLLWQTLLATSSGWQALLVGEDKKPGCTHCVCSRTWDMLQSKCQKAMTYSTPRTLNYSSDSLCSRCRSLASRTGNLPTGRRSDSVSYKCMDGGPTLMLGKLFHWFPSCMQRNPEETLAKNQVLFWAYCFSVGWSVGQVALLHIVVAAAVITVLDQNSLFWDWGLLYKPRCLVLPSDANLVARIVLTSDISEGVWCSPVINASSDTVHGAHQVQTNVQYALQVINSNLFCSPCHIYHRMCGDPHLKVFEAKS